MTDNIKKCFTAPTTIIGLLCIIIILLIFNYIKKDPFTDIINVPNFSTIYEKKIYLRDQITQYENKILILNSLILKQDNIINNNINLMKSINNRINNNTTLLKNDYNNLNTSLKSTIDKDTELYLNLNKEKIDAQNNKDQYINELKPLKQLLVEYNNALKDN